MSRNAEDLATLIRDRAGNAAPAIGLVLGIAASLAIAAAITARTDIVVAATLGWPEIHLVAGFVSLTGLLALLPAYLTMTRPVITDLRG